MNLAAVKFDAHGLVPAVVQDEASGTVLMLGYMNEAALEKTLDSGVVWFYSRSRGRLWQKGETSGHVLTVRQVYYDCDGDTVLLKVVPHGPVCHEGTFSCFSRRLDGDAPAPAAALVPGDVPGAAKVLFDIYDVILARRRDPQPGSYTAYLFAQGQDKMLKKVGEEAAETIIAAKNQSRDELLYEMADLWYHCLVLLAQHELTPAELLAELSRRRQPGWHAKKN